MNEELDFEQVARIKVIGVGGGGNNAVNRMVEEGVRGVEFFVANTDVQVLRRSPVENKIVLGKDLTKDTKEKTGRFSRLLDTFFGEEE